MSYLLVYAQGGITGQETNCDALLKHAGGFYLDEEKFNELMNVLPCLYCCSSSLRHRRASFMEVFGAVGDAPKAIFTCCGWPQSVSGFSGAIGKEREHITRRVMVCKHCLNSIIM